MPQCHHDSELWGSWVRISAPTFISLNATPVYRFSDYFTVLHSVCGDGWMDVRSTYYLNEFIK